MAVYVFTINGVTKTLQPGWSITEAANARNRMDFSVLSLDGSFRVENDDEIELTEDGTTIFGGLVDRPAEAGFGGVGATSAIVQQIGAVDYGVYASRESLIDDIPAGTLKAALTVVATALSAFGVTLDVAQVNGPSLPDLSYNNRPIVDVLNELTALASGTGSTSWVWEIDYTKTLRAYESDSIAAPFDITDGDGNVDGDITIEQPQSSEYGNYVRLYGGSGLKDETDTFTGDGVTTTFTLNYTLNSSAGYVTVNGVTETLGSGGTWTYDAATNSITRSSAPAAAAAIVINYVAAFPRVVIADGGLPAANRVVRIYTAPDVFDAAVLQALADAYLTRDMASPKTVRYNADFALTDLHPGQEQTITSAKRDLSGSHLLTAVRIQHVSGELVQRQVTAVSTLRLPATLREQFQQTVGGGTSSASAAAVVTTITSGGVGGAGTAGNLAAWATTGTLGDTGLNYTGNRLINIGAAPSYELYETDQGSNAKRWGIVARAAILQVEKDNDTAGSPTVLLALNRSGELTTGIWKATTVGVQWGGTGAATFTSNGVLYGNSTGAVQATAQGPANSVLTANAGAPAFSATPTVTSLTANTSLTTPTIGAAANLTISPTGDLILAPGGVDVLPNTGYTVNIGALTNKFLTLHAAELWVETLVAQDVMATIGGRIIVAPTTLLVQDLAAGAGNTTIHVKHNNLSNGDRIRMEAAGKVEWMSVDSSASGSAGNYTYTVTRGLDGASDDWYAGDAIVNTGTTGSGFIDLYSVSGVLSGSGPTIVGNVRTGSTYNSIDTRWAIGNLNGLYGYATTTFAVGLGVPSGENMTLDATNGLRIRQGTTTYAQLASSTFTLGLSSGNRVAWDGTNLTVVSANLQINSSGVVVAPNSSTYAAGNGYGFSTTLSGTPLNGVFAYEVGTVLGTPIRNAFVSVQNQTSRNDITVSTWVTAKNSSRLASLVVYAKGDAGTAAPLSNHYDTDVWVTSDAQHFCVGGTGPTTAPFDVESATGTTTLKGQLVMSGASAYVKASATNGFLINNSANTANLWECQDGGTINFYMGAASYQLRMDTNGDLFPRVDNTKHVGIPSNRFAYMTALAFNFTDASLDNGWSLTEAERIGIAEPGVALVDEKGALVAFFGRDKFYAKTHADVDDLPYAITTLAQRINMDRTPEIRIKSIDAAGRPVYKTKADVPAMPDPSKALSNRARAALPANPQVNR